jgi:polar amino acid transport system substrate-binding protein
MGDFLMRSKIALPALLGLLAMGGAAEAGAVLDKVMKEKLVIEVTDQAYPPFSYMGDNNEIVGFDIDIAREFAKRLGAELKVETPSWEIITAGNWQGRWDICICSMTATKERAEVLDFVTEYYAGPAIIVVNADDERIKSPKDLTGMKVGAQAGTTYEHYLNKDLTIEAPDGQLQAVEFPFADLTPVPYDSEVTAFQDLGLGAGKRLDAIVAGYLTAKDYVEKSGGKFKVVGDPLFREPIWVATDKGDAEWEAKIKEIFAAMQADGTLKAISEKWVGIDITTTGS